MSQAAPRSASRIGTIIPGTSGRGLCILGFALVLAVPTIVAPKGLRAQGCSQCTQAVGQTPPATQDAYRRGIIVLVLAAGGVFTSALVVLKRFR